MRTIYLILTFLIFSTASLQAQEYYKFLNKKYTEDSVSNAHHYKHYPILAFEYEGGLNIANADVQQTDLYPTKGYQGFTMRAAFESNGENIYDQLWRDPTLGIGYYAAIFPNVLQLGAPNAVFLYMDIPIQRNHEMLKTYGSYTVGGGLSFNFRPQNDDLNPGNLVIGSYSNVYINFDYFQHFNINKALTLTLGAGFTHFSNGASNLPNLGMNMLGLKAGLKHNILRATNVKAVHEVPDWKKKRMFYIFQAAGAKALSADGGTYFNTTTSIGYKWWQGYKSRWLTAFEIFYDSGGNSGEHYYSVVPVEDRNNPRNLWSYGLFFGHEAIYKRFSLIAGLGTYLYQPYNARPKIYTRFGMRYRLYQGLYAGVAIKARIFSSDYIEWGLGYNLDVTKKNK